MLDKWAWINLWLLQLIFLSVILVSVYTLTVFLGKQMVQYVKWVNIYHHFKTQSLLLLCVYAQSYLTLCNPMGCSLPGFSVRQGYWSGLPFPTPGDRPDPRIGPASLASPALAGRLFTTAWEALFFYYKVFMWQRAWCFSLLHANFCSMLRLKADPFSCTKQTKLTSCKQNKIELGCCLFFLSGQDSD